MTKFEKIALIRNFTQEDAAKINSLLGWFSSDPLESLTEKQLDIAVDKILLAQIRANVANSPEVQASQRRVAEIEEQSRRAQEDQVWGTIFGTPVNGLVVPDNLANRREIISWRHYDEAVNRAWFVRVVNEQPALLSKLAGVGPAMDRKAFQQFLQVNGFSEGEANFSLAANVLGKVFNESQLRNAVQSGRLQLAPRSADELEADAQQEQEKRQRQDRAALLGTDEGAAREVAQRHSTQERQSAKQQALEREIVLSFERDCIFGSKTHPMPLVWNGKTWNAEAIKNALVNPNESRAVLDEMKALFRKFGSAQITARMNGVREATAVVDRGDGRGPIQVSYQFQ